MPVAKSSYLDYLPPVLWQDEPPLPDFSLGAALRIFEKLLSGIDDGVEIVHGNHRHDAVEEVVERIHDLFDPWATPPEYLEWLASWLALRFPSIWKEYERRKVTCEIVDIYRGRGTMPALRKFLELYTVAKTRPRIAVDDSSRILSARLVEGMTVPLATFLSQGSALRERLDAPTSSAGPPRVLSHPGPLRPHALALAPDGSLLLADEGTPTPFVGAVAAGVWRVSSTGGLEFGGTPQKPRPLQPSATSPLMWAPTLPIALVVDSPPTPTSTTPWALYVLDPVMSSTAPMLYELTSPGPCRPPSRSWPISAPRSSRRCCRLQWCSRPRSGSCSSTAAHSRLLPPPRSSSS